MAFRICPDDPITSLLRERFPTANIVRTPRASIRPLLAIGYQKGKTSELGVLADLLSTQHILPQPSAPQEVSSFKGKRSPSLSHKVAFSLMGGVLKGVSGDNAQLFQSAFSGGDSFSLEVTGVQEQSVTPAAIGDALNGAVLDMANLVVAPFAGFKPGSKLLIIDRVITATRFTLHATTEINHSGKLEIPAVTKALATADLEATYEDSRLQRVSFRRDTPLTFAFTAMVLSFGAGGALKGINLRGPNTQLNPEQTEPQFNPWPAEYAYDLEER